jgi:hypothetical protein
MPQRFTFEDWINALNEASSWFNLEKDLPVFRDGQNDLLRRLHALEAQARWKPGPPTKEQKS